MKRLAILFLTVTLVFTSNSVYAEKDEPSSWAVDAVDMLNKMIWMDNSYLSNYQDNINRETFIYFAVRMYEVLSGREIIVDNSVVFKDTDDIYARKGATVGITTGIGNQQFGGDNLLTREQLATFMIRVLNLLEADMNVGSVDEFTDDETISDWAKDAIYLARSNGILSGVGDNRVNPQGTASVETAIVLTSRILNAYDGKVVVVNGINYSVNMYQDLSNTSFLLRAAGPSGSSDNPTQFNYEFYTNRIISIGSKPEVLIIEPDTGAVIGEGMDIYFWEELETDGFNCRFIIRNDYNQGYGLIEDKEYRFLLLKEGMSIDETFTIEQGYQADVPSQVLESSNAYDESLVRDLEGSLNSVLFKHTNVPEDMVVYFSNIEKYDYIMDFGNLTEETSVELSDIIRKLTDARLAGYDSVRNDIVLAETLSYQEVEFPTTPKIVDSYFHVSEVDEDSAIITNISFEDIVVKLWFVGVPLKTLYLKSGEDIAVTLPYDGSTYEVTCFTSEGMAEGRTEIISLLSQATRLRSFFLDANKAMITSEGHSYDQLLRMVNIGNGIVELNMKLHGVEFGLVYPVGQYPEYSDVQIESHFYNMAMDYHRMWMIYQGSVTDKYYIFVVPEYDGAAEVGPGMVVSPDDLYLQLFADEYEFSVHAHDIGHSWRSITGENLGYLGDNRLSWIREQGELTWVYKGIALYTEFLVRPYTMDMMNGWREIAQEYQSKSNKNLDMDFYYYNRDEEEHLLYAKGYMLISEFIEKYHQESGEERVAFFRKMYDYYIDEMTQDGILSINEYPNKSTKDQFKTFLHEIIQDDNWIDEMFNSYVYGTEYLMVEAFEPDIIPDFGPYLPYELYFEGKYEPQSID